MNNKGISNGNIFMNNFLKKLKNEELKVEKYPKEETSFKLSEEFISNELNNYKKLLNNDIFIKATKDKEIKTKKLFLQKRKNKNT